MIERRIKAARFPATKSLPSHGLLRKPLPGNGQLRLHRDPVAQQDAGPGAGALRMDRPLRERHRPWSMRHRQDPRGLRPRPGRLSERDGSPLHHRRRHRSRVDGSARWTPTRAASEATGETDSPDHRRTGLRTSRAKTGAELLFELISQRYERGSILITSNLPFDEWTETFGSERLTGALLDRLTHHVRILEMNGDSYRLVQSKARQNS